MDTKKVIDKSFELARIIKVIEHNVCFNIKDTKFTALSKLPEHHEKKIKEVLCEWKDEVEKEITEIVNEKPEQDPF